ncbi:MAG: hypothetical protein ACD_8C00034G0002 [uncultured bacterium]|nr:MAG: hypothetical protein ACD_8C00034G0002 [uncultured bacterium]
MNKKIGTILGILIAIGILAGGYFFAVKKGFLEKKEITFSNSINSIEQTTDNAQDMGTVKQPVASVEESVVEQPKNQDVKKQEPVPVEKSAQPEKVVESEKQNPPTSGEAGKIVDKLVSWGFAKSSNRKIDTIIVHSSYNSLGGDVYDPDKIIGIYKQYDVSAHYLISRDGTAYRLVEDKNISWHAGVSKVPDGRTNVNDFSIGIEMINTMDGKYTEAQYETLNQLIKNLKSKYEIKYILGHDEISPGRKTDPWNINWDKVNR